MISIKTSNNIFCNKRVILDYLDSNLFESKDEFEQISWLELRISDFNSEEKFEEFLEEFFRLLGQDFFIDIICYERTEKLKSRLRSYGKLFYELRKNNFISDKNSVEKELDTDESHSIFTGIIQVDEVDDEIIFNEIFEPYFKFGHVELKHSKTSKPERLEGLIKKIDLQLLRNNKLIEVDYLILLERFVSSSSMVFSYMFDGKDDLVFTVYSGKGIKKQIEEVIQNSLPKELKIKRIDADSKEIDRLIDSYFRDWKTIKS
jgi:hypothetical protein